MNRRLVLYAFLVVAASARIFMQVAAMPPYAGLDEIQHVAHLAFVRQEHRSPTTREASIPAYLDASILQRPDALPSFAQIGAGWPEVVRANRHLLMRDRRWRREREASSMSAGRGETPPRRFPVPMHQRIARMFTIPARDFQISPRRASSASHTARCG